MFGQGLSRTTVRAVGTRVVLGLEPKIGIIYKIIKKDCVL